MNTTVLDEKGIIQACPACGQRNRVAYERLGAETRCGQCKQELPGIEKPVEVQEEPEFQSLLKSSSVPLLVDFWADWCGPCKMMAPELQRVASRAAKRFLVVKVNTEGLPGLAGVHQIRALPTLVLFQNGREKARTEGARPAVEIERFVGQSLRVAE